MTTLDYYVPNDEKATLSGRSITLLSNIIMGTRATLRSAKYPNGIYIDTMVKKAMSSIRWYSKGVAITKLYGEICFPEIVITAEQFDAPIMKN